MIQITRDQKAALPVPQGLSGIENLGSFTLFEDDVPKGRIFFSDRGEEIKIEEVELSGDSERESFFDGLVRALVNYAQICNKARVFCENKKLFPGLLSEGFLPGEGSERIFAVPGEFFKRRCCGNN